VISTLAGELTSGNPQSYRNRLAVVAGSSRRSCRRLRRLREAQFDPLQAVEQEERSGDA
jgi:hypothetical protein